MSIYIKKQPPEVFYKKGVVKNFAKSRRSIKELTYLTLNQKQLPREKKWNICFFTFAL